MLLKSIAFSTVLTAASLTANAFTVGLAMPTQIEDRWYNDGFNLEKMLKQSGYNVELFFGGDIDVPLQKRQIQRLSESDVDVLVIGAIDGSALTDSLKVAKQKKIPVISFDRLITNTDAISYYATFDNGKVGQMQGSFLIEKLKPSVDNPKNIEIFYGSLDDNNAKFFYNEAMKIIQPYIDSGALKVLSGQTKPEETETKYWRTDLASKRMNDIMDKVGYGTDSVRLDGILSPADCISSGIIFTLKKRGYSLDDMPVITGQDATPEAISYIREGYQGMTVLKDSKVLCTAVLNMIQAIKQGTKVPVNDDSTYDNGRMVVESYLCEPKIVTAKNINSL
ncbi:MAG: sugar-binding protein [Succinivibrio sp.]